MVVYTQKFVLLSDILKDLNILRSEFNEDLSGYNMTWGTNNRSMVDKETFKEETKHLGPRGVPPEEWYTFVERLKSIEDHVLIDLEN